MNELHFALSVILLGGIHFVHGGQCPQKYQVLGYGGKKHSRCLDPAPSYKSGGASPLADQAIILNKHNEYRSNVNPPATNMMKMSWDDELATIAFGWASQCTRGHESSFYWRQVPDLYPVGQNVARGSTDITWSDVLKAWHDEVNGFVFGDETQILKDHAHYTQITWHDSSRIGCATAICDATKYFVCNYAPTGNLMPGWTSPYTSSTDGSSCGKCQSHCSNKLCDLKGFMCYNSGTLDLEKKTCACTTYSTAFNNGAQCTLDCSKILPDPRRKYYQCPRSMERCMLMRTSALYCPDSCNLCPKGSASGTSGGTGGSAGGSASSSGGTAGGSSGNTLGGSTGQSGSSTWWKKASNGASRHTSAFTLWKYTVAIVLFMMAM